MTLQQLKSTIEKAGYKPTAYSGRGMCGKRCVSVYLGAGDQGQGLPKKGALSDSMGKGSVIYWPAVEVQGEL